MNNLFISKDSEVKVEIWVSEQSPGRLVYWSNEEFMKSSKVNPDLVSHLEIVFREPNYLDSTELADIAMAMERDGSFSMSMNQVRLERVCRLLKSWNLTNDKGEPVSPTRGNVERLHPFIAMAIASTLEDRLGVTIPSEEDEASTENT